MTTDLAEPLAGIDLTPDWPTISTALSLAGWHRELCVELLGGGQARVFVRAVARSSRGASELQQGRLFHRLDVRFQDLAGCAKSLHPDLERLACSARRAAPCKDNLFITLQYDRATWDRIETGLDRWARR